MAPKPEDRSTIERLGPWVLRLPTACNTITIWDPTGQKLSAVVLPGKGAPGREELGRTAAIESLCSQLDELADCAGQMVTVRLSAGGKSGETKTTRSLLIRVLPVSSRAEPGDDPSLVRILTKHTERLNTIVASSTGGLVGVYERAMRSQDEANASLRRENETLRAEVARLDASLREATDIAETAISRGEKQNLRGQVERQLVDVLGGLLQKKMGIGDLAALSGGATPLNGSGDSNGS